MGGGGGRPGKTCGAGAASAGVAMASAAGAVAASAMPSIARVGVAGMGVRMAFAAVGVSERARLITLSAWPGDLSMTRLSMLASSSCTPLEAAGRARGETGVSRMPWPTRGPMKPKGVTG
eukprot:15460763-Alexandrium_andersonii.AAC.1